jgi:hypothetical protein
MMRSSIRRSGAGFTLTEMCVAGAVALLLMAAAAAGLMFSGRSFAVMANYVDLGEANRLALEQLTRDVREADRIVSASAISLTLSNAAAGTIVYTWNSEPHTLTRNGRELLTGCCNFRIQMGQRSVINGTLDVYDASAGAAKVVMVDWTCVREGPVLTNAESVNARIAYRKQPG